MLAALTVRDVKKTQFPWVIAVVLVVAYAGWHLVGLALAGTGLFIAYLVSLKLHPRMRHGRCGGSGEVKGKIFVWTHRKCPGTVCQGGRQIRWGAGIWGPKHIRSERGSVKEARTRIKQAGTWK